MQQRPAGVTIIAVIAIIGAIIGLCGPGVLTLGSGAALSLGGVLGFGVGAIGLIAGLLGLIGPIIQLIFGIGALNLKGWAWWMGIIGFGVSVVGALLDLFNGQNLSEAVLPSIIPILLFVYLLLPNVRAAFRV